MKKKTIFLLVGIVIVALIATGLTGKGKKVVESETTLEQRIVTLEAEIAELKGMLKKGPGMKVDLVEGGTGPGAQPFWTGGLRGWDENGTDIWTSNLAYQVGIGTAAPAYNLDISGDMRITGGINDGVGLGLANDVLVADGLGGVQWAATPGGSGAYIWNQNAAMRAENFWMDGIGQAGDGNNVTGVLFGVGPTGVYGQSNDNAGAGVIGDGMTITTGVYGTTDEDSTFGVWGYNANASGTGVAGAGNGATTIYLTGGSGVAGSGPNVGVFGYGDATAFSWGVFGTSDAADGAGVVGIGTSAGGGMWMQNSGVSGSSDDVGVYGYGSTTAGSNGMWARSGAADGRGLMAVGNAIDPPWTFGAGAGVEATGDVFGVVGFGDGAASYGVYGYALGAGSYGVRGRVDNGQGVRGTSAAGGEGVFGGSGVNETGVAGGGDAVPFYLTLATGSGGAFTGNTFGVAGYTWANSGTKAGGYFDNYNGINYCYVAYDWGIGYKINGTGFVATIMETRAGKKNLFAPESPEPWFEDLGEGQLRNGRSGKIPLDPLFLDCIVVNSEHPLKVFVQLRDDCKGAYVKTYDDGFEVIEFYGCGFLSIK